MRTPLFLTALLLMAPLAGCTGPSSPSATPDASEAALAPVQRNTTTGASEFLRPQWVVGRWWDVQFVTDNGYGFLNELDGRLIVSTANASGYRVGADGTEIGVFDRYFDHFHVGDFDAHLNASLGGVSTQLFAWPLAEGKAWTTQYVLLDEYYGPKAQNMTLRVSAFDGTPANERLRVQGEIEKTHTVDYDYSAKTGWMTYFRLVNKTTGRIVLSVDFLQTGLDHKGLVHHITSRALYERVVYVPACDDQLRCSPRDAGIPPAERASVASGYDWVEEIAFLFVYPIKAGGGVSSYTVVRPDLNVDHYPFKHAGTTFGSEFKRTIVRGSTAGEWSIALQATGTAGVFLGLYGFNDEATSLQ